jgi:hypothetical protein
MEKKILDQKKQKKGHFGHQEKKKKHFQGRTHLMC